MISLNYGQAIEAMKQGSRVQRAGWNGKGMCVFIQPGSISDDDLVEKGKVPNMDGNILIGGVSRKLFGRGHTGTVVRMPCFVMKAADGSHVTGWLASQTDMLAEDWQVVA